MEIFLSRYQTGWTMSHKVETGLIMVVKLSYDPGGVDKPRSSAVYFLPLVSN